MSKTFTSPYVQTIRNLFGTIAAADTTTLKQIGDAAGVSSGAEGSVLKSLGIVSTSTSSVVLAIWLDPDGSGTSYLLGTVTVPPKAGSDGVTAAARVLGNDLLPHLAIDAYTNSIMNMQAGAKLYAAATATMTSGQITILAECGDF